MGAKGGKHKFQHEGAGEGGRHEPPLPGRKHLTRKLTDRRDDVTSVQLQTRMGYRYTPAESPEITQVRVTESPEITEVRVAGSETPYWRVKWPRRTISLMEVI